MKERTKVSRETNQTAELLKVTAKKHTIAESSTGGLVIPVATCGSMDLSHEAKALTIDDTVPMQALVHHNQLHTCPKKLFQRAP
ncbi:hypothetical protein PLICRDRAFT_173099 [Plicaturopsis crispa FD-325 SS-3]|nr:hypothetical protein PLICRDRAFT_173099 [Plicaturopsis crispa FD-325 SS-3]